LRVLLCGQEGMRWLAPQCDRPGLSGVAIRTNAAPLRIHKRLSQFIIIGVLCTLADKHLLVLPCCSLRAAAASFPTECPITAVPSTLFAKRGVPIDVQVALAETKRLPGDDSGAGLNKDARRRSDFGLHALTSRSLNDAEARANALAARHADWVSTHATRQK
jgi:hypothetical protein